MEVKSTESAAGAKVTGNTTYKLPKLVSASAQAALWRIWAGVVSALALAAATVVALAALSEAAEVEAVPPEVMHHFAGEFFLTIDDSSLETGQSPRVNVHAYTEEDFGSLGGRPYSRYRLRSTGTPKCGDDSCDYVLELFDAASVSLGYVPLSTDRAVLDIVQDTGFKLKQFETYVYDPPEYDSFAIREVDRGASALVARSPNAPSASVSGIIGGDIYDESDLIRMFLSVDDVDGDDLNYRMFISRDGSKYSYGGSRNARTQYEPGFRNLYGDTELNIVPVGHKRVEIVLPRDEFSEPGSLKVGFSVSDGTRSVLAESPEFWLGGGSPVVRMSRWSNNEHPPEDAVEFWNGLGYRAAATVHGERIPGLYQWFSSRDGFLGTDLSELGPGEVSVGTHVLSVLFQDLHGRFTAESIRLTMNPPRESETAWQIIADEVGSIDIFDVFLPIVYGGANTGSVDSTRDLELVVHELPGDKFDLQGLILPENRMAKPTRHECTYQAKSCKYSMQLLAESGSVSGYVYLTLQGSEGGSERRFKGVIIDPPDYQGLAAKIAYPYDEYLPHSASITTMRSGELPVVGISGLDEGQLVAEGEPIRFTVSADDQGAGELSYRVFFSTDGGGSYGRYWQHYATGSIPEGADSVEVMIPNMGLPGTDMARIGISVASTAGSVFAESPVFKLGEHAPMVVIEGSRYHRTYTNDGQQELRLEAVGFDFDEAWLSEASFAWHSSIDGMLGTGRVLDSPPKSFTEGSHVITVTVTNRQGVQATDSIELTITAPLNEELTLGQTQDVLKRYPICEQVTTYC